MKFLIKLVLWKCGLLHLYHRVRNRNTLTIIQLHRVLPDDSLEYQASNQEYALTISEFEACLTFCKAHYNVVSQSQVQDAKERGVALPKRALLISFDDGWQDNVDYAEPLLLKHGLRATVFLNTEAIEEHGQRWWQDALVEVYEKHPNALRAMVEEPVFYKAAQYLAKYPLSERRLKIADCVRYEPTARQMLTVAGVKQLNPAVWDIGSHGVTHVPLTFAEDSGREYADSAVKIFNWTARAVPSFAYPHGRYDERIISEGFQAGYTLLMSSDAKLNGARRLPSVLGRVHIPSDAVRDSKKKLSDMSMAYFLWLRALQAAP